MSEHNRRASDKWAAKVAERRALHAARGFLPDFTIDRGRYSNGVRLEHGAGGVTLTAWSFENGSGSAWLSMDEAKALREALTAMIETKILDA